MRDPLVSVIIFFSILLLGLIISIAFEKFREAKREKEIKNLLEEFEYLEIENMPLDSASINALLLLAKAYEKEGEYEKAIKIYVWVNKSLNSTEILKSIAFLYFKAGFLKKAKEIVYEVLKVKPRDVEALKLLILINEKIGELKEIIEVLEIFEVLEVEFEKEKAYALYKLAIGNGCGIDFCEDNKSLEDIFKKYPFIKREYLEYLFRNNPQQAYTLIDSYEYLDLFYFRNDKPNFSFEKPFELRVVEKVDFAELEFEYICQNCKKVFPLYSSRCPHCYELFTQKLLLKVVPKRDLEITYE